MVLNVFYRLVAAIQRLWFDFEIVTSLYMLEPNEKIAFTSCLVVFLATATYSTYIFLPHYTLSLLQFLGVVARMHGQGSVMTQIRESEEKIETTRYRIDVMERKLRLTQMTPEEQTVLSTEVDEARDLLKRQEDELKQLFKANRQTAFVAAALVFLGFLVYGVHSML